MKPILPTAVALALLGIAAAQTPPPTGEAKPAGAIDPKEILTKVDAATKAVNAVKYQATFRGTGTSEFQLPKVKGSVILSGKVKNPNDFFRKVFIEAVVEKPGGGHETRIQLGSDGESYFLIDPERKRLHEDIAPDVYGNLGQSAMNLVMREYTHPTPFSDELNGQKVELRSDHKVGDQDCYQIHVVYSQNMGEAVWYFAKKDHLPRRVDRTFTLPGQGARTMTLELTDVVIDPKIEDAQFTAQAPEGFTKTNDPAP